MKHLKHIGAALCALGAALTAQANETTTTALTSSITAGSVVFSTDAPATHSMGAAQPLTDTGVPVLGVTTFAVAVSDLRGTNSGITVGAELLPLKNTVTNKVRTTKVIARTATGDNTGVAFATMTTASDAAGEVTANFVTATAMYNRAFGFTVELSADAMARHDAHSGNYEGSLELTVN